MLLVTKAERTEEDPPPSFHIFPATISSSFNYHFSHWIGIGGGRKVSAPDHNVSIIQS